MAVNVRINGADYPDVPAIDVPKTNNGGTATFYDCSGDTATAADVASGKTCHTAGGLITGTAVPATGTDGFLFEMQASGASPKSFSGASGSTFYGLQGLKKVSISGSTAIVDSAFISCAGLENVSGSDVETLGGLAFSSCYNLVSAVFPKLKFIGNNTFASCEALTQANYPLLQELTRRAFYMCKSLVSCDFTSVTTIGTDSFYRCEALISLRFPALTGSIATYAFDSCRLLKDIYIGSVGTVPTLAGVSAFNSTPIAMSGSYSSADARIHVRADMVSAFQAATNWSTFASKIVGDYSD